MLELKKVSYFINALYIYRNIGPDFDIAVIYKLENYLTIRNGDCDVLGPYSTPIGLVVNN